MTNRRYLDVSRAPVLLLVVVASLGLGSSSGRAQDASALGEPTAPDAATPPVAAPVEPSPAPVERTQPELREGERERVLVLDVTNNGVPDSAVKTLGSLLVVELSELQLVDVVSGEDVRRMMELEAERTAVGCDNTSCLAEIAGALGATVVVFGDAGRVGSSFVFNLSLFDVGGGRSLSRVALKTDDPAELPDLLAADLATLVMPLVPEARRAEIVDRLKARADEAKKRLQQRRQQVRGRGMLVVRTVPPGATISVDGREVGHAPITVEDLSDGDHLVEASFEGRRTAGTARVTTGEVARLELNMDEGIRVSVKVVTNPPDAVVFVDGERAGISPLLLPSVPSGPREITLALRGHQTAVHAVTLDADAWLKGGRSPLRLDLALKSNASDREACGKGNLPACGAIATSDWLAQDQASAVASWQKLCDAGSGNVCGLLAELAVDDDPKAAQKLARRGCSARDETSCQLYHATLLGDPRELREARTQVRSSAKTFMSAAPVYAYASFAEHPSCGDQGRCEALCSAGSPWACSSFGEKLLEGADQTSDPRATRERSLEVLAQSCGSEERLGCKVLNDAELAYNREFADRTLTRYAAAPTVGATTVVATLVGLGVGVPVGALAGSAAAFVAAAAVPELVALSPLILYAVGIGVGGALSLALGVAAMAIATGVVSTLFSDWVGGLAVGGMAVVAGLVTAGALAGVGGALMAQWLVSTSFTSAQLPFIPVALLAAVPAVGIGMAALTGAVALPFFVNDDLHRPESKSSRQLWTSISAGSAAASVGLLALGLAGTGAAFGFDQVAAWQYSLYKAGNADSRLDDLYYNVELFVFLAQATQVAAVALIGGGVLAGAAAGTTWLLAPSDPMEVEW